jgi:hypothetical protein
VLALTALACGCRFVVPPDPVAVPARAGVESLLWPLVPALAALALPAMLTVARQDLERSAVRPWCLRTGAVLLGAAALGLTAVAGGADEAVLARNALAMLGVATLSASVLRVGSAWAPVAMAPLVCWLLGTDAHRHVHPWALLLLPGSSCVGLVVAGVLAVSGTAAYVVVSGPGR